MSKQRVKNIDGIMLFNTKENLFGDIELRVAERRVRAKTNVNKTDNPLGIDLATTNTLDNTMGNSLVPNINAGDMEFKPEKKEAAQIEMPDSLGLQGVVDFQFEGDADFMMDEGFDFGDDDLFADDGLGFGEEAPAPVRRKQVTQKPTTQATTQSTSVPSQPPTTTPGAPAPPTPQANNVVPGPPANIPPPPPGGIPPPPPIDILNIPIVKKAPAGLPPPPPEEVKQAPKKPTQERSKTLNSKSRWSFG